ncbi:MAG: DUF502 domain-containing protein [Deltaproteobacteria bacterium]|nr:DUF502 domain-containing protein [Deltaproteobacteria bacterium]
MTDGPAKEKGRRSLGSKLRTSFVTGLVVILPLFITFLLLRIVTGYLRSSLHGTFHALFKLVAGADLAASPYYDAVETILLFAIGLPIVLLFILFVGWLARQYIGQRILRSGEVVLKRIPLIGGIYDAVKELVNTIFMRGSSAYRSVVLVEYPRPGVWVLGFVTALSRGEVQRRTEKEVQGIFVPTTPNPTSGFLIYVPREELVPLDMSVEEGIKLVISGGVVEPPVHPEESPSTDT